MPMSKGGLETEWFQGGPPIDFEKVSGGVGKGLNQGIASEMVLRWELCSIGTWAVSLAHSITPSKQRLLPQIIFHGDTICLIFSVAQYNYDTST